MVTELLLILIPLVWLTLTTLVLAVCRVAARADAASGGLGLAVAVDTVGAVPGCLFPEDAPAFHEMPAGFG
jgi:hypothetical protein